MPFPAGANHWAVLGLPRRLALSRAELEAQVHALNRRFHPDYFRLRPEEEQAISLDNSAAVNVAYRVLRDPGQRVEYLLESEGMALGSTDQSGPTADLFEEIMAVQEARQELALAGPDEAPQLRTRLSAARADLQRQQDQAQQELFALCPSWDAAAEGERGAVLGKMRDVLARRAYLRTVLRDLDASLEAEGERERPSGG